MHRGDPLDVGGVLGCVDRGMHRLAVHVPLLQRDAEHGQGEDGGHDVGEVVDEVDAAALDLLVEAGARHVVDERLPALDRGRGQIRVEHGPVGAVLGVVHLQDAAADGADAAGRGDRNAFIATAFAVDVVVVGDRRAARQLEDLVAAGRHPVAAVGIRPGHGALGVHLFGDGLELRPILGRMPIEVVSVLLPVTVIDDVVDTQRSVSLSVSLLRLRCRLSLR